MATRFSYTDFSFQANGSLPDHFIGIFEVDFMNFIFHPFWSILNKNVNLFNDDLQSKNWLIQPPHRAYHA